VVSSRRKGENLSEVRSEQSRASTSRAHCAALKIVATIQDVFDGNVAEFLKQDTVVFGDIREL